MQDPISFNRSDKPVSAKPVRTRRTYPKELKSIIVSECLAGTRSVASIALEHGINANLVHKWIRLSRESATPTMVPVTPPVVQESVAARGHIELRLSGATVRLYGDVGERQIRTVLRVLQ
jgi:transposase